MKANQDMTETVAYINRSLQDLYPKGEVQSFTRLIMEHVCRLQPYQLLMGGGRHLSDTEKHEIHLIVERLKQFEPIQYILGETSFCGLKFRVNPSVLIPRPETEELIECILNDYDGRKMRILDIGTGSGCIAISVAHFLPTIEVIAVDISEEAIQTAEENARINNAFVSFIQADILYPDIDIPGTFDIIVSNPPYVKENEQIGMEKNVLQYEPRLALFVPDNDPLLFYRAIARLAKQKLNVGGALYFEINAMLGKETVQTLKEEEFTNVELIRDLSGKDRIIKAQI
ncbi:release factor glutamine methyltransferase [Bacteroidia bacterium]|nr:release factor glutamine methyltransferase [Bacteroidia bacterium]